MLTCHCRVGVGEPVAVIVKLVAFPCVIERLIGCEVTSGAVVVVTTVNVKLWVALGVVPLLAVNNMVNGEPSAVSAVPFITPVRLSSLAHEGRPAAAKVGAGVPVARTVKLPGLPTEKLEVLELVMAGATGTVLTVSTPF